VDSQVGALGRHIALVGFMGAGKSTIGREVARLTGRPFVDTDALIHERFGPIPELFRDGEAEFRRLEEQVVGEVLAGEPAVIALGGGAVLSRATRDHLRTKAFAVWLHVAVEEAWARVGGSDRPLAEDEAGFRALFAEREGIYRGAADALATDADGVLLAALGVVLGAEALPKPAALIADERVLELHEPPLDDPIHRVPPGEAAKTVDVVRRLWGELQLGREGTIVAFGGGSTTDLAGFVAATYLRGVRWIAVPTTLTGQVDAAIGGKTGVNLSSGKNLVGAFHFPQRVVIDLDVLASLPEEERRAGMAEVVKIGILGGRAVWELPQDEMIRACAAFKCGVVISDPYETEGRRQILNLGHTFAHALEAGSAYTVSHGEAVALGLLAALRLSGQPTDIVEEVLRPEPARADREAAWAALKRDKKGEGVFVLVEGPGRGVISTVPDGDARSALNELIRD
jgi:shikimate kinase / 3-dehydroquinate synthase